MNNETEATYHEPTGWWEWRGVRIPKSEAGIEGLKNTLQIMGGLIVANAGAYIIYENGPGADLLVSAPTLAVGIGMAAKGFKKLAR